MMSCAFCQKSKFICKSKRIAAYTLVELLIVMFIMVLLAGIALPTVKDLIADQRVAKTARNITAYIDAIRNRAIAEDRRAGIRIERLSKTDEFGRRQSIRIRELVGVPPYSGDASDARIQTLQEGAKGNCTALFDSNDNALLWLSCTTLLGDPRAPIRVGDYIELPGGLTLPITGLGQASIYAKVTFNLRDPQLTKGKNPAGNEIDISVPTLPGETLGKSITRSNIRYRIHRRPVVSSSAAFSLPRGVVIDLSYSGTGQEGHEFAPKVLQFDDTKDPPVPLPFDAEPIDIIFAADGRVESITTSKTDAPAIPPNGQVFLCLGDSDGIRPDNLVATGNEQSNPGPPANIANLESKWIVINANTGRTTSSPFSSIASADLSRAIKQARGLATNYSDTVDIE